MKKIENYLKLHAEVIRTLAKYIESQHNKKYNIIKYDHYAKIHLRGYSPEL